MQWLELLRDDWWILGLVVVVSIGSLLLLPFLVVKLPTDYFLSERRQPLLRKAQRSFLGLALLVLKNLFGLVLLLLGCAMLVLPGQGVLTMFSGLVLLDFPGKYRCERWLASRGKVLDALNWLRAKRGRPPLLRPSGD